MYLDNHDYRQFCGFYISPTQSSMNKASLICLFF